ncbi:MAG: RNA polymerase sigma-70 factor [Cyclobacteriaceae bacterium]|nr:RNA polymerase sigma-70 factor [Cyclobacteriaceae bacterium HetDA_MAG_MS6]
MTEFRDVYEQYHQRVFGFILSLTNDREQAKDILQEVFIKVWEELQRREIEHIESLLFTISKNKVIDIARKEKVRKIYRETQANRQSINVTEQTVDFRETKERVDAAIRSLPPKRREIFTLSRFEGKSYQEIADHMKISKNTVEVQMVKALKYMRSALHY